ncbi:MULTISPECIES: hypothetical protein [Streptomyces]|uniref:Uncharacterized protein n=1 Tax=Streptomyces cacaoi TaxID=1898 RepID=A0A4Y3R2I3_STRCI|nr:hypothetical protein [Streptomyces cacaoi]NNG84150.1 hypothetical protein [Streptomyces cacaoi]GEB50973.1 hypothetical protein SCA03_35240 [Streptomyces cacaoi]
MTDTAQPPGQPTGVPAATDAAASTAAQSAQPDDCSVDSNAAARRAAFGKLGLWFVCAVVFALAPTVARYLSEQSLKNQPSTSFYELANNADLYVVCIGLTAGALGQAFMRKGRGLSPALIAWSLFNMLVLFFTSWMAAASDLPGVDEEIVGRNSLLFLLATVISTGTSTYLAELETS